MGTGDVFLSPLAVALIPLLCCTALRLCCTVATSSTRFMLTISCMQIRGSVALRASRILTVDEARQRFSRVLHLDFSRAQLPEDFSLRLKHVVENHRAAHQVTTQECPIVLSYQHAGAVAKIALGEKWRVQVCESLLQSLAQSFGQDRVTLKY